MMLDYARCASEIIKHTFPTRLHLGTSNCLDRRNFIYIFDASFFVDLYNCTVLHSAFIN